VRDQDKLILPLLAALNAARAEVVTCSKCGSFTVRSANPCACCSDDTRETTILCVVEEPADIVQIESSGAFKGKYHCLGGKLALSRRSGPEKLRFAALVERVEKEGVREVLLALSTDMEGDATASYAAEILKPSGVKVTRLAFGLPADSGIAYSDPLTLRRAITGRLDV
jgi:recombination protein RecR